MNMNNVMEKVKDYDIRFNNEPLGDHPALLRNRYEMTHEELKIRVSEFWRLSSDKFNKMDTSIQEELIAFYFARNRILGWIEYDISNGR